MSNSDFMKRLQAMREGKQVAPEQPSLKNRLVQGNPATAKAGSSSEEIRARIQARFNKKTEPVAESAPPSPPPVAAVAAPTENTGTGPLPEFEMGEVPQMAVNKEEKTQQWTPENGGVCPSCNTFNMGHVAFCGDCGAMLLRSEETVEIITSYPLSEIQGLVSTFVQKLAKYNIHSTEDVLRVATRHSNRATLVKRTGMSERSLLRLVHQCDFCRIPSLGPENAAMLELIGVTTLDKLRAQKPMDVYKKIQQAKMQLNKQGILFLPTKAKVKTWFEELEQLQEITIT